MEYDILYSNTLRKFLECLGFYPLTFTYLNGDQIVYIHPEKECEDLRLSKIIFPRNCPVLPKPFVNKIMTQIKAHNFSQKEINNCLEEIKSC